MSFSFVSSGFIQIVSKINLFKLVIFEKTNKIFIDLKDLNQFLHPLFHYILAKGPGVARGIKKLKE